MVHDDDGNDENYDYYDDAQGGLLILRNCGSWCKLIYSTRTVPPSMHLNALHRFKEDLVRGLVRIVGQNITDRNWELAQMSIKSGGVGVRYPVRHAGAACVASIQQTKNLCQLIDPAFDPSDACNGLLIGRSRFVEFFGSAVQSAEEGALVALVPFD